MSEVKAISPADAKKAQAAGANIPDFVIEIVNNLINVNFNEHGFTIKKDDVINAIVESQGVKRSAELPDGWIKWLDFEPYYRARGWNVTYDQPAYCESYPATYSFRSKKK